MAMGFIWVGLVLASLVFGALTGKIDAVASASVEGAGAAVTLCVSLAGAICLWSGVMEVMRRCGLLEKLTKLLRPLLARLFPSTKTDPEAAGALSLNVAANLLGLGNAATPAGIRAAKALNAGHGDTASREMTRLVVMNTASIQLIPMTVCALRAAAGAPRPFDILPAVWLSSAASLTAGLLAEKVLGRRRR